MQPTTCSISTLLTLIVVMGCCLKPSPLSLRCSSSDPFACFHRTVLVACDRVRNDDIRERLKVENITESLRSKARLMCLTRDETRPRIRREKDSGDGTTWEKKKRKTEAEMDGLCQPRHESYRNNRR